MIRLNSVERKLSGVRTPVPSLVRYTEKNEKEKNSECRQDKYRARCKYPLNDRHQRNAGLNARSLYAREHFRLVEEKKNGTNKMRRSTAPQREAASPQGHERQGPRTISLGPFPRSFSYHFLSRWLFCLQLVNAPLSPCSSLRTPSEASKLRQQLAGRPREKMRAGGRRENTGREERKKQMNPRGWNGGAGLSHLRANADAHITRAHYGATAARTTLARPPPNCSLLELSPLPSVLPHTRGGRGRSRDRGVRTCVGSPRPFRGRAHC